jgi:hypothetical protein
MTPNIDLIQSPSRFNLPLFSPFDLETLARSGRRALIGLRWRSLRPPVMRQTNGVRNAGVRLSSRCRQVINPISLILERAAHHRSTPVNQMDP